MLLFFVEKETLRTVCIANIYNQIIADYSLHTTTTRWSHAIEYSDDTVKRMLYIYIDDVCLITPTNVSYMWLSV